MSEAISFGQLLVVLWAPLLFIICYSLYRLPVWLDAWGLA